MVDILPLRGLFYNKNKVRNISKVISPPYDVISPHLKKELYKYHPFNIINLTLPEGKTEERYIRAGKTLTSWIDNGILKTDSERCFYVFEESFVHSGDTKKISGFIGLTRIEPYSNLKIIPHEKTSSTIKKDRLKLLSECRTNFGLVYTLYNDRQQKIKLILKDNVNKNPVIDTRAAYDNSLRFKLWKISDNRDINIITDLMKNKKLIIADGHHRYETSLNYRNNHLKQFKQEKEYKLMPEDFILTLYIDSNQSDFLILPNYRLLKFKKYPGLNELIKIISNSFDFEIQSLKSNDYIKEKLSKSKQKGLKSFFLYDMDKNSCFLTLKKINLDKIAFKNNSDKDYLLMDINILHKFFMEQIAARYKIKKTGYSHSINNVIDSIDRRKFDIGIFLNPPSVFELERTCAAGYIMPEKSTYFYPKPCSGLVMYKFDSYH